MTRGDFLRVLCSFALLEGRHNVFVVFVVSRSALRCCCLGFRGCVVVVVFTRYSIHVADRGKGDKAKSLTIKCHEQRKDSDLCYGHWNTKVLE